MRGHWLLSVPVCPSAHAPSSSRPGKRCNRRYYCYYAQAPCCVVQVQQLLTQVDQLTDDRDYFDKQVHCVGSCGALLLPFSLCDCGNKSPMNTAEQ